MRVTLPLGNLPLRVKSRRKLRDAELRLLHELLEPTRTGIWYFPAKNLRTLRSLAGLGLAKSEGDDGGSFSFRRHGYSITELGRVAAKTGRAG